MSWNNRVVWSEGMFVATQHFQQHDRYLENLIDARSRPLSAGASWVSGRMTFDAAGVEIDLEFVARDGRGRQYRAPLRLVNFAIADHQADLPRGGVEIAFEGQALARLQQHFVLIDKVGAQRGLRSLSEREIIGTQEIGGVFQLEKAHTNGGRLAVGTRIEPCASAEMQRDGGGISRRVRLLRGLRWRCVLGARNQQQRNGCGPYNSSKHPASS